MSAANIKADYRLPKDKFQKEIKDISMDIIKGKWIWEFIDGVEVKDIVFYLSFTENNLILSGSTRNSITAGSETLFASFFYLSDTIDDTFNIEKMSNKYGKYIIVSNTDDITNGKTTCMMISKENSNKDECTLILKSRFYDSPAKIKIKKDTSYTNTKMPILISSHIYSYNDTNTTSVNNNNLLGEWRVNGSIDTIVTFSKNGCVSLLQKSTSNGITTDERYKSFYYLSNLPDSHFDLSKLSNAEGKCIVVKNPFYDELDDTIVFFIKLSDKKNTIMLSPYKEDSDLILIR